LQNWQDYLANHVNLVILSELTSLTHTVDFFSATAKAYSQPAGDLHQIRNTSAGILLALAVAGLDQDEEKEVNGHVNG